MRRTNDEAHLAWMGFGEADKTADSDTNYRSSGDRPQWIAATSRELVALVLALRTLFPASPLPSHIQRALGREWGAA